MNKKYDKLSATQKERLDKGVCLSCGQDSGGKKYCYKHMKKISDRGRLYYSKIKKEILEYYGNKCSCCGEDNIGFLTIDHMNLNTQKEKTGTTLYRKLFRNGFRDDLRILCYNCNMGRKRGICPHKKNGDNLYLSTDPYSPR